MASLRRTLVLTVALAVTAALVVIAPANAAPRFLEVIVVLDGEPGRADGRAASEATARQHGVETSFVYEHALRGFAGRVPEGRLNGLRNDPRVAYVEADGVVQVSSQTVPTGVQRIFAEANPAIPTTGSGKAVDVDVAVLDTGIDASHPDLDVVASIDCTLTTNGPPGAAPATAVKAGRTATATAPTWRGPSVPATTASASSVSLLAPGCGRSRSSTMTAPARSGG